MVSSIVYVFKFRALVSGLPDYLYPSEFEGQFEQPNISNDTLHKAVYLDMSVRNAGIAKTGDFSMLKIMIFEILDRSRLPIVKVDPLNVNESGARAGPNPLIGHP